MTTENPNPNGLLLRCDVCRKTTWSAAPSTMCMNCGSVGAYEVSAPHDATPVRRPDAVPSKLKRPRQNPQVESLECEVKSLRLQLADRRRDPGDMPVRGCGDNSCLVEKPHGMATNGGCRCSERTFRLALQWWKRRAAFLEETIRTMKEQGSVEPETKETA